jgi:hypothetical protein
MSRPFAVFKARELLAHQRIWVFWFVALIALAAPWLWLSFPDREPGPVGAGNPVAVERQDQRPPAPTP